MGFNWEGQAAKEKRLWEERNKRRKLKLIKLIQKIQGQIECGVQRGL